MTEFCISCARGFYEECGHSPSEQRSTTVLRIENTEVQEENETDESDDSPKRERKQRSQKPDEEVRDQQSTGRKRAARLFPLERDSACEWADASPLNPKGGGTNPITFPCREPQATQRARHHGPDKNTLNNDLGNVHRICHFHHNNWHLLNDKEYDPNKPLKD